MHSSETRDYQRHYRSAGAVSHYELVSSYHDVVSNFLSYLQQRIATIVLALFPKSHYSKEHVMKYIV